jgi:hypothetical protein
VEDSWIKLTSSQSPLKIQKGADLLQKSIQKEFPLILGENKLNIEAKVDTWRRSPSNSRPNSSTHRKKWKPFSVVPLPHKARKETAMRYIEQLHIKNKEIDLFEEKRNKKEGE